MVGEPGVRVGESKNVHVLIQILDSHFGSLHIPVKR